MVNVEGKQTVRLQILLISCFMWYNMAVNYEFGLSDKILL